MSNQRVDEYNEIINDSIKKINKLKILVNFFNQDYLQNICIRIQIIHQLFEINKELDIFKLSAFNAQFTDSVIELLSNIKKIKEQNILLLYNEISINKGILEQIKNKKSSSYLDDKIEYNKQITKILKSCYQILSKGYNDVDPFFDINFNEKYKEDLFIEISSNEINKFESFDENQLYLNNFFNIQKKLLGIINKFEYNIEFIRGFKNSGIFLNVFKINNEYFFYFPQKKLFLLCDKNKIEKYLKLPEVSKNEINKYSIQNRIKELEFQIEKTKIQIPEETEKVLKEFLEKINSIDFIENLQKIDIQTNILKSMLKNQIL